MSEITKKFKKYKIKPSKETIEDFCEPKNFKLQPQQKFVADYFSSKDGPPGMLVYHQIGAGKTCAAISVAENSRCFSETSQLSFTLLSIQNLAPLVNVAALARSTD